MVRAFTAIADFMLILLSSAMWVGAGIVGAGLLALCTVGGAFLAARRWWRLR